MFQPKDILPAVYRSGKGLRTCEEDLILSYWEAVAGPDIAEQTRPLRLVGSTLNVEVESSEWQRELRRLSPVLIHRLNAALGATRVERIEFYLSSRQPSRKPPQRATALDGAHGDESQSIADPVRRRLYQISRNRLARGSRPS